MKKLKKKYICGECGKRVKLKTTKFCYSCSQKGSRNHQWKNKKDNHCPVCGITICGLSKHCNNHKICDNFKGRKHTEEAKKKIGAMTKKIHTGMNRSKESKQRMKDAWARNREERLKILKIALSNYSSEERSKNMKQGYKNGTRNVTGEMNPNYGNGVKMLGSKNPNWRDGLSNIGYLPEFNEAFKTNIRKKYDYICQICGKSHSKEVHHIDYNKKNNEISNFSVLCKSCHTKTGFNRDYWQGRLAA